MDEHGIEARAPLRLARAHIEAFVLQKAGWIAAQQARFADLRARRATALPQVWWRGECWRLEWLPGGRPKVELADGVCRVTGAADRALAEALFERHCRREAARLIPQRLEVFRARWSRPPARLRISSARRRWGSCSSRGTLSFSWRLMAAPDFAIDYVIAHELAHLREMNHSPRFWAEVARLMPDWQRGHAWLKAHPSRADGLPAS